MAFRWRACDGPTLNAGLVALRFLRGSGPVLLRNPYNCYFSGGVRTTCPSSGSAHGKLEQLVFVNHMSSLTKCYNRFFCPLV